MTVARIAPNAETSPRILLVDSNSQRHMKRLEAGTLQIVMQMLNALFVAYGWIFVRRAGPRLSGIFASIAVYLIKVFGLRVIRFQLVVADGPGRRDSAVMTNLTEIFLP